MRSLVKQQRETSDAQEQDRQRQIELAVLPGSPVAASNATPRRSTSLRRLESGSGGGANSPGPLSLRRSTSRSNLTNGGLSPSSTARPALPRLQIDSAAAAVGANPSEGEFDASNGSAAAAIIAPARIAVLSLASPTGLTGAPSAAARRKNKRDHRHRVGPTSLHLTSAAGSGGGGVPRSPEGDDEEEAASVAAGTGVSQALTDAAPSSSGSAFRF
jgi:hypothetical protein